MPAQLFISSDGGMRELWRQVFPEAKGCARQMPCRSRPSLVQVPPGQPAARLVGQIRSRAGTRPLIILADEPTEDDALAALGAGAAGYCNSHAAPDVLQQVATVVENGGLWVGQRLMQRLLAGTARLASPPATAAASWATNLTERERKWQWRCGRCQQQGSRTSADITERTVKAHVGAILDKLGRVIACSSRSSLMGIETGRPAGTDRNPWVCTSVR